MARPTIAELEQAVIDAVKADQTIQGYLQARVETLSERVFDWKTQSFVARLPLVAVFYAGGSYRQREVTGRLYTQDCSVILVAAAENLRGPAEARRGFGSKPGCLDIIEDLRRLFAGKELTLASNTGVKPVCFLGSDQPELTRAGQAAWSLELRVQAHWDAAG